MSEFFAEGNAVLLTGKLADPEQATAISPIMAQRIADALSIVDEASDAELQHLRETGVFPELIKAWRKENRRLLSALADEAAGDAAFKRRHALAAE